MELEKVWAVELEILDQIDAFCREHGLKYSIAYGTLLGAVRHGGFIPWDDDVDILMPRTDYEYLLAHWNVSGFVLQNKRTNDDFSQNFTKIRKDHTTYLQYEEEKEVSYHTGIFVDIFPADRAAPPGLARKLQFACCAVNLLYSREHTSGAKSSQIERIMLALPRNVRLKICYKTEKLLHQWDASSGDYFSASTIVDVKRFYSPDLFDGMIYMEFSGKKYMCFQEYELFLKTCYGDYLKLPPEEERVLPHQPLLVDLEHNYKEIMDN